jgi:hypothetical protein
MPAESCPSHGRRVSGSRPALASRFTSVDLPELLGPVMMLSLDRVTGRDVRPPGPCRSVIIEHGGPALASRAPGTPRGADRVARRLADNKKFASRASKTPSLLQGLAACSGCGYACYRGHTTTAGNKIFYYRCIGSDNYRFEHGKVCDSKPVRADYLDQVIWDHITHLIADPSLIRAEIGERLAQIRTADPATTQRKRLDDALAKTTSAIARLIAAYQEDLLSLDELRARMPDLRGRETSLRHQAQALDAQVADREVYLKLADNLEDFLATLRKSAVTATVEDRQRVLRLLVKEVLVGPGKIVIRHSIPARGGAPAPATVSTDSDDDAEPAPGSHLRWRSHHASLGSSFPGRGEPAVLDHARLEPPAHQSPGGEGAQRGEDVIVAEPVECRLQVRIERPQPPGIPAGCRGVDSHDRVMAAAAGPESVGSRLEPCFPLGFQRAQCQGLKRPVGDHGNTERATAPVALGHIHPPDRAR